HHLVSRGPARAAAPVLPPASVPPVPQPIPEHGSAGTAVAAPPVPAPASALPGVQLLFHSQRAGIDNELAGPLASLILGTERSLDCAIYDLRYPQALQALATVAKHKHLRIAYDAGKVRLGADPKPGGNQEALQQAGLTSVATSIHEGSHLMHNKFLIR